MKNRVTAPREYRGTKGGLGGGKRLSARGGREGLRRATRVLAPMLMPCGTMKSTGTMLYTIECLGSPNTKLDSQTGDWMSVYL